MDNRLAINYAKVLRGYVKEFEPMRYIRMIDCTDYRFEVKGIYVVLEIDCTRNKVMLYDDFARIYRIDDVEDLKYVLENVYGLVRA